MDIYEILLVNFIKDFGEEFTLEILSNFSCPKNEHVEDFIRNKAINLAKQNVSPTHLIYTLENGVPFPVAFYTLTIKVFEIPYGSVPNTLFKKLQKFGNYDETNKTIQLAEPLIAQLGKNFTNGINKKISGTHLLTYACQTIISAQRLIGGKTIYVECENRSSLRKFYETNDFRYFGHRATTEEEGGTLIQYLKYSAI